MIILGESKQQKLNQLTTNIINQQLKCDWNRLTINCNMQMIFLHISSVSYYWQSSWVQFA